MTRDETIALWQKCESARVAAITEGKSADEAHEKAKGIWNAWAHEMLCERTTLEKLGDFKIKRIWHRPGEKWEPSPSGNISSDAWFHKSTAEFSEFTFTDVANFSGFIFPGIVLFGYTTFIKGGKPLNRTVFKRQAYFNDAMFQLAVVFDRADFQDQFIAIKASFHGTVNFGATDFNRSAIFYNSIFYGGTWFGQAKFFSFTSFNACDFRAGSSFIGCECKSFFDLSNTVFYQVPDFTQAHFAEAPRLDSIKIKGRMLVPLLRNSGKRGASVLGELLARVGQVVSRWVADGVSKDSQLREVPARWRALKHLAIQSHDTDRELQFFSGEVRSARFAGDWPFPWPVWKAVVWSGFFRFWFGILYEIFSDFGRSVFRPFVAWSIGVLAFAAFYLSQTEVMQRDLALKDVSWGAAAAQAAQYAVANKVPCYPPPTYTGNWRKNWRLGEKAKDTASNSNETIVGALSEKLRSQTNARAEALHLAFRNAFVVLDGGSDASHRMYGCLYGLEMYAGQNPVPIVPSAVSTASAIQKLISGVLIFLFGLALRNMLKVK